MPSLSTFNNGPFLLIMCYLLNVYSLALCAVLGTERILSIMEVTSMMPVMIVVLLMSLLRATTGNRWLIPSDQRHFTDITELDIPANATLISISYSSITSLPAGALNFPQCKTLIISYGELQEIHPDALQGFKTLEHLNVWYNKIKAIHPGTFRNSSELTSIIFTKNLLTELRNSTFTGLVKLIFLTLDYNKIASLESNAFNGLISLYKIDLSSNLLTVLPAGIFYNLPRIRDIRLNSNQLLSISENLFHHRITVIELHLQDNNHLSLPNGLHFPDFSKVASFRLSIDGNLLTPDLFQGLEKVMYLTLTSDIHFLTKTFRGLPRLLDIGLRGIKISSLPSDLFYFLSKLGTIDLGHNLLESLPSEVFQNLTRLHTLDLEDNKIRSLPGDLFHNLLNLKTVDLKENQLTTLPVNFFRGCPRIQSIDLRQNDIIYLEELGLPKSPIALILYRNPLNCTAQMCWIVHRKLAGGFINAYLHECQTPDTLQGRKLFDLKPSDIDGCEGKSYTLNDSHCHFVGSYCRLHNITKEIYFNLQSYNGCNKSPSPH